LLIVLLIILASFFQPDLEPTTSISKNLVTRVIDGDTIELSTKEKVRYIGVDTPERNECFFEEAKAINSQLVLNKQVRLVKDVSEVDRYGRLLRYVYVGDLMINYYLVRQGYAYASTYPPDVLYSHKFAKAQSLARAENKGFWEEKCYDKEQ